MTGTATTDDAQSATSAPAVSENTLRRLVRLHYVLAMVTALLALPTVPLFFGGWEVLHNEDQPLSQWALDAHHFTDRWFPASQDAPLKAAWLVAITGVEITLSVAHAVLLFYVGRCIARRRRFVLCVLFSVFNATYVPLGTALSIWTLVVLLKPHVKRLFFPAASAGACRAS
ncbi:MAG: hypothetical protein HYS13_10445 [Planctomycetia bacterium]|nr:hypothetical protein [Planctomycetia bacterium]